MFTNATSVVINNKEVQSIITSDGGVLYQKENDNYELTLASNKSILSYVDSESATLTATLTNNSEPVSGKTITFVGDKPFATTSIPAQGGAGSVKWKSNTEIILKSSDNYETHVNFGNRIYLGKDSTGYFIKYIVSLDPTTTWDKLYLADNKVKILDNYVLSYTDANDTSQTVDVSHVSAGLTSGAILKDIDVASYSTTATTNASGVAIVSYLGKGAGDLNIRAYYGIIHSESYDIIDASFYDGATSDRSSEYSKNCTMTYNSNGYYAITGVNSSMKYITHNIGSLSEPVQFSCDFKYPASNNVQLTFGLVDTNNAGKGVRPNKYDSNLITEQITALDNQTNIDSISQSYGTDWYHLEIDCSSTQIIGRLYDSTNTLINTVTSSYSQSKTYNRLLVMIERYGRSMSPYVRNLIVKPL